MKIVAKLCLLDFRTKAHKLAPATACKTFAVNTHLDCCTSFLHKFVTHGIQ